MTSARDRADDAAKIITGVDPRKTTSAAELAAQRQVVARIVFDLVNNRGFEPEGLIQMFIAGAAFLADNAGISRDNLKEYLCRAVDGARLGELSSIVVRPTP